MSAPSLAPGQQGSNPAEVGAAIRKVQDVIEHHIIAAGLSDDPLKWVFEACSSILGAMATSHEAILAGRQAINQDLRALQKSAADDFQLRHNEAVTLIQSELAIEQEKVKVTFVDETAKAAKLLIERAGSSAFNRSMGLAGLTMVAVVAAGFLLGYRYAEAVGIQSYAQNFSQISQMADDISSDAAATERISKMFAGQMSPSDLLEMQQLSQIVNANVTQKEGVEAPLPCIDVPLKNYYGHSSDKPDVSNYIPTCVIALKDGVVAKRVGD